MKREEKQAFREKIWEEMEKERISAFPLPIRGRIPNFVGSDRAAENIRELEEWKAARTIAANPDYAQHKIREIALREGKTLIMASPRLKHGYLRIDPEKTRGREEYASTIKGAFRLGEQIPEPPKPDLIITGCVAVDKKGYRLGKGGGYGDREIRTIQERFGKIKVVTTIHETQLVEELPIEEHDTKVDIAITPTRIIRFNLTIRPNRLTF